MSRTPQIAQLVNAARRAVQAGDWATVHANAKRLVKWDKKNPEGFFLTGLVEKALHKTTNATAAFNKAINLDPGRYDAAIELANQYLIVLRHADALKLLKRYTPLLENSPLYLDLAATVYSRLGLHADALPLFEKADQLQPGIEQFQLNLAASAVTLGKIDQAKAIYLNLLEKNPQHQRNHYQLSRLEKATDASHIEQMQAVLDETNWSAEKNIFMYYAIGKELEDLQRWSEAFHYYKLAGDAVASVANYDVKTDVELIDKTIKICSAGWLGAGAQKAVDTKTGPTPIFVVGLPRTGTTLTERIVSSHSMVESADETFFMQLLIRRISGVKSNENMDAAIIEAAANKSMDQLARGYLAAIEHRLTAKPMFIDKLPENILYLGFIAKAFPDARIIHVKRHPMDSCFAMYKQSFFRFAYTLDNIGEYYLAYDRLSRHWKDVLQDRVIEVEYEELVADQEGEIRQLLDRIGLDFEQACIDFDQNEAPSATASAVQVRQKAHTRSVGKWQRFATELQPLYDKLESAGIDLRNSGND